VYKVDFPPLLKYIEMGMCGGKGEGKVCKGERKVLGPGGVRIEIPFGWKKNMIENCMIEGQPNVRELGC
jgi:hypothetical protein